MGRRETIFYALAGSLPALCLMLVAHRVVGYATLVMVTGGLITGFTILAAIVEKYAGVPRRWPPEE